MRSFQSSKRESVGTLNRILDLLQALLEAYVGKVKVYGFVLLLVGLVGVPFMVYDVAQIPWDVREGAPRVLSQEARCGFPGAVYIIRVNGLRYECPGGDTKCGNGPPVEVAYDPSNPNRCRVARYAGRLSLSQGIFLAGALLALCFGAGVAPWVRPFPEGPRSKVLTAGLVVSCALLAICIILQLVSFAKYGIEP